MTGRVVPEQWRPTGAPAPRREPGTARIAVDLLGGDQAPAVVVDGALRAFADDPTLHLTLVGPAEAADAVVAAVHPARRHRLTTVLGGTAADAVAAGQADALVSAGDTAVTVLSAARALGRWPGIRRPPLAAVLPTAAGRLVLLDVGSTVDPDEETLATHARLGAAYATAVHGLAEPRVGLLTIGTEHGKGDRLRRAAARLLQDLPLNYAGLVEGSDVVLGRAADVVVTDGFTGNVLLKALEAATRPKETDETPAAVLLGVHGVVVVCHGAATGTDLAKGIAFAADLHRHRRIDVVQRGIA
ncbi:phosphate acyltransferase PlsX [Actinoplanes ianthinogenes]|uniref:phosphate acyltransferase PlsX n=1 Tax=Actinoplanes ianthinogenes TaxID=122358 RepID=UPI0016700FD0|nr:phosphate acyltransferase PlsX [Actinoplanes ianthinogenes]